MGKGAKTKGYIKNNTTGDVKKFQYNPPELRISRGATYAEISSPGIQYPLTQFVRGNLRDFSIELYFYNRPYTGYIPSFIKFLEKFLPPETNKKNYKKPPALTFCWGLWIRKCVLLNLDVTYTMLDNDSRPIEATCTLSLRQVGV